MIGYVIAAIIAVLVIGLVFKLAKVAIIVALVVGGAVLVRNFIAQKRIK
jgi:hypothetical protein